MFLCIFLGNQVYQLRERKESQRKKGFAANAPLNQLRVSMSEHVGLGIDVLIRASQALVA